MMKKNEKRKNSTMKKLIPAAGMLALSASMLATSTYAWFTMNKVVEVTGLQMQATASSGLEISLGAWGTQAGEKAISVNTPTKEDISWKRSILVSDYYSQVGKILPSSTDTALSIYKVPAANVYAGGHAVEANAAITSATKGDSVALNLQRYGSNTGGLATIDTAGSEGYFIDIPMWIRSSNQADTPVYATVTITDPQSSNGSELIKAARVAIIPIASADEESDTCAVTFASASYGASTDAATVSSVLSTQKLFGLKAKGSSAAMDTNTAIDWPTYHDGIVINSTGAYAPSGGSATLGETTLNGARGVGETSIAATNVFTIPAAKSDDYGRVGFVARVWLEGESIYCEDATANQDWNIDFYFSTDDTALDNYVAPTPATPEP